MSTTVYAVRCPDGIVRRPLAAESDEQTRRRAVYASGSKGKCSEPCPGGRHVLEQYTSADAFEKQHLRDKRVGPAIDPIANERPWLRKERVQQGSLRACTLCHASSPAETWIRERCPQCRRRA